MSVVVEDSLHPALTLVIQCNIVEMLNVYVKFTVIYFFFLCKLYSSNHFYSGVQSTKIWIVNYIFDK